MHHGRPDTHTHAGWYAVQWAGILAHYVYEGICYLCPIHRDNDANFDFSSRRQSPLQIFNHYPSASAMSSRRPWLARQCAEAGLAHAYPQSLIAELALVGRLQSPRTFSVNSVPRVVSGTARLCTSFTDMPFPVKVKAPSLKGLFSSSKKRTKAQGQGASEVQSAVPDR